METANASAMVAKAAQAAPVIAAASSEQKNSFLQDFAENIEQNASIILQANKADFQAAQAGGLAEHLLDRLSLDEARLSGLADSIRQVCALPDPVGQIIEKQQASGGYELARMRVPLGVIGFIYESRPGVTADGASLCIKSGNAVILRGGKEAWQTNQAIAAAAAAALAKADLPAGCVGHLSDPSRTETASLIADEQLDLLIPRGGPTLVAHVREHASAAVLSHENGNCHLYVDEHADLDMACSLAVNGKVSRPAVCNALEKLLIHERIADRFVPQVAAKLLDANVSIRGCERICAMLGDQCTAADQVDWHAEYLSLKIAMRIVDTADAAIMHINRYGSKHTDAICTANTAVAEDFMRRVDSASVMFNVSTRFADGYEYGLGAEVGIATGKLHARGPVGLEGLTSLKWIARGDGQVRI